ncbi:uncharacterized protein B0T23DRAFT_373007 [Neurospora hispaniola]|uniref:Uncharacterized protein n=1 Tax=Neurospora hispaniola TaxID=588809 RepID=A0AAJ0IBX8_9PEZI|nr:hypothetical protein B0T23DRAFT_373007 [Neurospora hispaniola]
MHATIFCYLLVLLVSRLRIHLQHLASWQPHLLSVYQSGLWPHFVQLHPSETFREFPTIFKNHMKSSLAANSKLAMYRKVVSKHTHWEEENTLMVSEYA